MGLCNFLIPKISSRSRWPFSLPVPVWKFGMGHVFVAKPWCGPSLLTKSHKKRRAAFSIGLQNTPHRKNTHFKKFHHLWNILMDTLETLILILINKLSCHLRQGLSRTYTLWKVFKVIWVVFLMLFASVKPVALFPCVNKIDEKLMSWIEIVQKL